MLGMLRDFVARGDLTILMITLNSVRSWPLPTG